MAFQRYKIPGAYGATYLGGTHAVDNKGAIVVTTKYNIAYTAQTPYLPYNATYRLWAQGQRRHLYRIIDRIQALIGA